MINKDRMNMLSTTYVSLAAKHRVVWRDRHGQGITESSKREHQKHGRSQESLRLGSCPAEPVQVDPKESDTDRNDSSCR